MVAFELLWLDPGILEEISNCKRQLLKYELFLLLVEPGRFSDCPELVPQFAALDLPVCSFHLLQDHVVEMIVSESVLLAGVHLSAGSLLHVQGKSFLSLTLFDGLEIFQLD